MGLERVTDQTPQSFTAGDVLRAGKDAVLGGLGDQWLEVIEAANMGEGVVFTKGSRLKGAGRSNGVNAGTEDVISSGSRIHVYDNQAMLLVDSGAIVDVTAEPGVYTVNTSSSPSVMVGQLEASVRDTFERFRFGGVTPRKQQAYYVNLQEIKGIRFGTPNPINYFDSFYNAELFLRCHGTFSIKITDPILFYREVIARNASHVHINDIQEQYMAEFLEALQSAINQMSVDGVRISQVTSKAMELSRYMREALDQEWRERRGIEVCSVGIAALSYDDASREIIDMRSKGAALQDPSLREGYVQGSVARGIEAAGSNEAGAGTALLGVGIGMQAGSGFTQAASASNQAQMAAGAAIPTTGTEWNCADCSTTNRTNFCPTCGQPRPKAAAVASFCGGCGVRFEGARPAFCPECGASQASN
ncbi:SPFH domain-containing protein [Schaalia sp. Marseille-Q2122]|uniref:SPFH domain-containing protein n=1 Tax=Schaalia sp. Marseille-Q2122 TaxID=2736604 RepID=UPI00158DFE11|nr:SPFH domain-containing protein [Schaalia sp. Marseille-Q2122]